eukprot:GILK01008151.1.p1 GENE.GILK01008151.1~~GILK01008151.1.p1  ORF type:complete len:346 (+),score=34.57 GILK01008151.1:32-1039(+)
MAERHSPSRARYEPYGRQPDGRQPDNRNFDGRQQDGRGGYGRDYKPSGGHHSGSSRYGVEPWRNSPDRHRSPRDPSSPQHGPSTPSSSYARSMHATPTHGRPSGPSGFSYHPHSSLPPPFPHPSPSGNKPQAHAFSSQPPPPPPPHTPYNSSSYAHSPVSRGPTALSPSMGSRGGLLPYPPPPPSSAPPQFDSSASPRMHGGAGLLYTPGPDIALSATKPASTATLKAEDMDPVALKAYVEQHYKPVDNPFAFNPTPCFFLPSATTFSVAAEAYEKQLNKLREEGRNADLNNTTAFDEMLEARFQLEQAQREVAVLDLTLEELHSYINKTMVTSQ